MCGIAGRLFLDSSAKVNRGEIEAMLRPMRHRGPDGDGVYLDGPLGLGHNRLSIIDLTTGGQPMCNEDDSVWIVFNGEIYNYMALREELNKKGHVFRTRSDTEVIIHAYEEYGFDCLHKLRGMFAFAIWDARKRRLFIARDRVGIKPLYYFQNTKTFFFASELKAILTDASIPREINPAALRTFFCFNYLPGAETLLKGVRRLLPGYYLLIENGQTTIKQYWDLKYSDQRYDMPYDQAVEELYNLLAGTVRDHMIADVPVGILLSGGVDSSAVLSFAVRETGKKVSTFTVGFDGGQVVDERPYARLAAQRFGSDHHEITITAEDFWNFLPEYVWHMEDPVCEPPAVALYYVTKLARQHVKVVLSGEGGDEAFGGYPNYPSMLQVQRLERLLGPLALPVGSAISWFGRLLGDSRYERYGHACGRPLASHYFSRTSYPDAYFNRHANELFTPDFLHATREVSPSAMIKDLLRDSNTRTLLDQMLYVDTKTWLPDDLLIKADKMTMANSVELRVPLLDHKVLEFAASLPCDFKVKGKETKRILKSAFAKLLPAEVIDRKKAGFPVPYESWLRREFKGRLADTLLDKSFGVQDILPPRALNALAHGGPTSETDTKALFSLVVTALWCKEFLGPIRA